MTQDMRWLVPCTVPLSRTVEIYREIAMTQANDSILVTPGTGATVATHNPGDGKEYQVVMEAGDDGHIIGSKPDFLVYYTPVTNVTNREVCNLFVAATASAVARVRGLWVIPTETAVTGAAVSWNVNKTSTQGATQTAVTPRPLDSTGTALVTGIRAAHSSTTAPVVTWTWFQAFGFNEETNASTGLKGLFNLLPVGIGDRVTEIVLQQGEGLNVVQTNANAVGLTGALIYFVQG